MKIKNDKVYIDGCIYELEYYIGSILQYKRRIKVIKNILNKI